ncbi:LuxR family transcriptional regulator [Kribbella sandramycini]
MVSALYVGRQAELGALRAAAQQVREGGSARVLITGEAGIGKSRLVAEFTALLKDDWLTITGACPELGAEHLPYVAFLPIVQQLVDAEGGSQPGSALNALLPHSSSSAAASSRLSLLQELIALVERAAARRPLLLVVEDLHWADGASRELFGYLARNLRDRQVLLVGTVRTGEVPAGHPVRQLVAELGRRPDITTLQLGPLEQQYVSELLTALVGRYDPARAAAVHQRSGGNPLFIEALANSDPGNPSANALRSLLQERVARLSEAARPVLAVASVAGSAVAHELLALLANRSDDELDQALRELVERDQLLATTHGYQFRHALIREAVYTGLLPGERRRLHARAATALAEHPDLATQTLPAAELAEHWFLAGRTEEAYRATLVAADEAKVSFAYTEELRHLERAIALCPGDHPDRLMLLERAIAAAGPAGQAAQGLQHCTAALELVDRDQEPERAAQILLDRAQFRGRLDLTGRVDLDEAERLLPSDRPTFALGVLHYHLTVDETVARRPQSGRVHAERVLEIAEALDDDRLRCRAYAVLGHVAIFLEPLAVTQALQAKARELAVRTGDDYMLVANGLWECAALTLNAQYDQIVVKAPQALREAELLGMQRWRGPLLAVNLCEGYLSLGRWDEAVETIEQTLAAEPEELYVSVLQAMLSWINVFRGNFERAESLVQSPEALSSGTRTLRGYMLGHTAMIWADLAVARHEPELAGRAVELFLRNSRDTAAQVQPDQDGLLAITLLQRARLAAAPRNREIAADVAKIRADITGLLHRLAARSPLDRAYRLSIEAGLGSGRMTDWDECVAAWREVKHLPALVLCLIHSAEAALAASNRAGARKRLEEARELALKVRATVWLDRIEALGQRARLEAPAAVATADASGLTPREYDVLRLVARGLPNRQIAAELYISPATVGVHVGRILTKLGAASRTEATATAHAQGLLTPGPGDRG